MRLISICLITVIVLLCFPQPFLFSQDQDSVSRRDCKNWNLQFLQTYESGLWFVVFGIAAIWFLSRLLGRMYWAFTGLKGRLILTLMFIVATFILLWVMPVTQTTDNDWLTNIGFIFPFGHIDESYVDCMSKSFDSEGLLGLGKDGAVISMPWKMLAFFIVAVMLGWLFGYILDLLGRKIKTGINLNTYIQE
jgi:hypothetical protein